MGLLCCTTPGSSAHIGIHIDITQIDMCINLLGTEVNETDKVFGMDLLF